MSKYIIDVGDAYIRHGLERTLIIPVRINEHEDHWMDTRIPVTPYTEPDLEQVREEAYDKGYQDATVKISSDEQAIAEKAYQSGLNDTWAAARKLWDYDLDTLKEIFGWVAGKRDVFIIYTAAEAIEKIRQYEQEQKQEEEQIQVGDEVEIKGVDLCAIYMGNVNGNENTAYLLFDDGSCGIHVKSKTGRKTGRHFPEIAEVLRKMMEES